MKRRTFFASLLFVVILLSIVCSTLSYSQEVDRDKDEATKTEEERALDENAADVMAGRKRFLLSDRISRSNDRIMYQMNHPDLQPTILGDFGSNEDGSRKIQFTYNYTYGQFNIPDLSQSDELYDNEDSFVVSGSFTKDDLDWFESRKLSLTLWSMHSAKLRGAEAIAAVALTRKKFNTKEIVLFDGLPSEIGTIRGRLELSRMGLPARPKDWLTARQEIRAAANGIPIHNATKSSLIKELKDGAATFLLVIAHSDSSSLYLPGLNGGRLSMKELMQIQRQQAPDRVIVLLACKVGEVNNRVESIAEVILHNKLATAVLAANNYVYAADLSNMIAAFVNSGKLGGAFPGLKTIVEKKSSSYSDHFLDCLVHKSNVWMDGNELYR